MLDPIPFLECLPPDGARPSRAVGLHRVSGATLWPLTFIRTTRLYGGRRQLRCHDVRTSLPNGDADRGGRATAAGRTACAQFDPAAIDTFDALGLGEFKALHEEPDASAMKAPLSCVRAG